MLELAPEQELLAKAAHEEKEARLKARVLAVKPGAFERHSDAEAARRDKTFVAAPTETTAQANSTAHPVTENGVLSRLLAWVKTLVT